MRFAQVLLNAQLLVYTSHARWVLAPTFLSSTVYIGLNLKRVGKKSSEKRFD